MRLGVDIGGTFTDLTGLDEATGEMFHLKTLTDPEQPVRAVWEALQGAGIDPSDLTRLSHGTTIGINAIVERKGAPTAIVTTRGFRDILELRRSARTHVLDPLMDKPYIFVPRRWRVEVDERIAWDGSVSRPLDPAELETVLEDLAARGIESVAVCFLHSYVNPVHEREAGQVLARRFPELYHTLSSEIVPALGEYERTSTAALNAYVHPVVHRYLTDLESNLRERGLGTPLQVMQSNGGVMTAEEAARYPVHVLESGPAAGSIAGAHLAGLLGLENVVTLDMGGTTTKASVIEGGRPLSTVEYELFEEPNRPGSGWPIRVPMIDIVEVGAGGGTIAWLDDGNNLQVGPRSAGALPGPVCYGRGGDLTTVTDAYVVLGRLASLLGGDLPLDVEAARHAIGEKVARPLGMTVEEAAAGILEINDTRAADLLREMTISRGRDPRDFTLVAFGGAGPLVAAYVAREVGMELAVIPPAPGNFSAGGLLLADVVHDAMRTYTVALDEADPDRVGSLLREMSRDLTENLDRQGIGESQRRFEIGADLRYTGQFHVINVPIVINAPISGPVVDEGSFRELGRAFHQEHQRLFTYQLPQEPLELVNLRVRAIGALERPAPPRLGRGEAASALRGARRIYFREEDGRVDCPIYDRGGLGAGASLTGPAILEETTSTTLVPPGCSASIDGYGNILIRTDA